MRDLYRCLGKKETKIVGLLRDPTFRKKQKNTHQPKPVGGFSRFYDFLNKGYSQQSEQTQG